MRTFLVCLCCLACLSVGCEKSTKKTLVKSTNNTATRNGGVKKTEDAIKVPEKVVAKNCIKDMKLDAKPILAKMSGEKEPEVMYARFEDVDGDGEKEHKVFVPLASNAHMVLYVTNKGCLTRAGSFMGTNLSRMKDQKTAEHHDLELWTKDGGCGGLNGTIGWYKWDAGTSMYKSHKDISCHCPMTSQGKTVDPKCPKAG